MSTVLLALLLASPLTLAEPVSEPETLASFEAVRDLCAALAPTASLHPEGEPAEVARTRADHEKARQAALAKVYRVGVSAKGFAFGRYRASQEELELDGDRPLLALDNALALDLAGIDEVSFHATAAQVAAWSADKAKGQFQLVVLFKPDDQKCGGSKEAHWFRMAGAPRGWQLVDAKGALVAAADEGGLPLDVPGAAAASADKAAADPKAAPAAPKRSLQVARLTLDSDAADETHARLEGVQGALDRCAASARRSGALVVSFALHAGHVRDPQVIMDATRDESASNCVAQALVGAVVAGVGPASGRGTLALQFE